jgi:hypothetical protein
MADDAIHGKPGVDRIVIERRVLCLEPKAHGSFDEGFYEGGFYYQFVWAWIRNKVHEADEKNLHMVYELDWKPENTIFWALLLQASSIENYKSTLQKHQQNVAGQGFSPGNEFWFDFTNSENPNVCIINFLGAKSHKVKNELVHFGVKVMLHTPANQIPPLDLNTEAIPSLSRHNTPELRRRRAQKIAESNSRHTKELDEALNSVLQDFQKLSF